MTSIPVEKMQVILAKNILCPVSDSQTKDHMLYQHNPSSKFSPNSLEVSLMFAVIARCVISSHHCQHSQDIKVLLVYLAELGPCQHTEAQIAYRG